MSSFKGRIIKEGRASGRALCTDQPISFFGGVDPDSGEVTEVGHPLQGQNISGRILVFPSGKGSTVGSYALLRLARQGVAPAAMINRSCETIVAVGAIIAGIPCVDQIDIERIPDGSQVSIDADVVVVG